MLLLCELATWAYPNADTSGGGFETLSTPGVNGVLEKSKNYINR